MELVALDQGRARGKVMAAVTHVCTLEYVAKMLQEEVELLEAILCNEDNLTYGAVITVLIGPDEAITAMTMEGIKELKTMLHDARLTTETWHDFLDTFVGDAEVAARYRDQSVRVRLG